MPGKKLGEESLTTIMGVRAVSIERWPTEELKLDPFNPRFINTLDLEGKLMSEKEMENEIWDDSESKALYQSIVAYRGLTEKPWITADGTTKEGNRRLVVLRKILKNIRSGKIKDVPIEKFVTVECRVLPKEISDVELAALMGQWHVAGKREWRAHNQAKFIHDLYHDHGLTLDQISRLIGKSAPFLIQKKWAYEEMLKFVESHRKLAKIEHFSYFEELYKQRSGLPEFIEKGGSGRNARYTTIPEKMEEIYDLIVNERFEADGARGIRKLPDMTKHPQVYDVLKKRGLKKAEQLLGTIHPEAISETFEAVSFCIDTLNSMPGNELLSIQVGDSKYSMLKELDNVLHKYLRQIEGRK